MIKFSMAELKRRLDDGASIVELAEFLNCSNYSVYKTLQQAGLPYPKRQLNVRRLPRAAEIIVRLNAGETTGSIAKEAVTTVPAVHMALRRASFRIHQGRAIPDHTLGHGPLWKRFARIEDLLRQVDALEAERAAA